jgi:membrane protein
MMQSIHKLVRFFKRIFHFLTVGIWHLSLDSLPKTSSKFIRQLRILVLSFRGFKEDECRMRASALTYYSLMSLVPVAAMAFAIAKGFGFEETLKERITEALQGNEELMNKLLGFMDTLIEEARGGIIAGVGFIVLIWAIMEMFSHIEESFNEIWEQKEARSFSRKFSDYLSMLLIAPILILLSSSTTVFVSAGISSLSHTFPLLGYVSPILTLLMQLMPFVIVWTLFTIIYLVMPNTKVKFRAALLGGVVAGTVFQFTQMGYFIIQIELIDINAVYGSFAALPLLFLWLRISWILLLYGAEVSYAQQNVKKYEHELDVSALSHQTRKVVSLLIVQIAAKNFSNGIKPLTNSDFAVSLKVPLKLIKQLTYELVENGILAEIRTENEKEFAFQPAIDIHLLSINYVLDKMETYHKAELNIHSHAAYKKIYGAVESFATTLKDHAENRLLIDID